MAYLFLLIFLVPIAALCWRLVVSKTRAQWLRVGAAAAVMPLLTRMAQAVTLPLVSTATRATTSPSKPAPAASAG